MPEANHDVESIVQDDVLEAAAVVSPEDKQSKQELENLFAVSIQEQVEMKRIDMEALNNRAERVLRSKNAEAERLLRTTNANRSYTFSFCWAAFIALTVILKGFGEKIGFKLTTTEFLSVIGALSATILTYYGIVVRPIFPTHPKDYKEIK